MIIMWEQKIYFVCYKSEIIIFSWCFIWYCSLLDINSLLSRFLNWKFAHLGWRKLTFPDKESIRRKKKSYIQHCVKLVLWIEKNREFTNEYIRCLIPTSLSRLHWHANHSRYLDHGLRMRRGKCLLLCNIIQDYIMFICIEVSCNNPNHEFSVDNVYLCIINRLCDNSHHLLSVILNSLTSVFAVFANLMGIELAQMF